MARTPVDPTDYSRTTQPHCGESMIDTRGLPGFLLLGLAVVAFAAAVGGAGYGHHGWALLLAVVGLVLMAAGAAWLYIEHRRLRRIAAHTHPESHSNMQPPVAG
jgi:uncharacterized membrane protein YcjF (UPF0283 family)